MSRALRGVSSQQEVFESAGRTVSAGPVLRASDPSLRPAPSDFVVSAVDASAARTRFAEGALCWDSLGAAHETRLARLARLTQEAHQMLQEEEEQQEQEGGKQPNLPPAALAQLRTLHEKLQRGLEQRFDASAASELPGGFLAAPRHETSLQSVLSSAAAGSGSASSSSSVVYEVFARDNGAAAALERRVAALEEALGRGEGRDLHAQVRSVREQLTLLTPDQLASNAEKMRELVENSRRAAAQEVKTGALASEVQEALQQLSRWDSVAAGLPAVVDRLVQLRQLHEAAARTAERLSELEKEQKALRLLLEDGKSLLATVQQSVKDNQSTTDKSVAALLERVEALK